MQLTPEDTKRIQSFLFTKGFIQEAPSEFWTPHKSSGYATYLESRGVAYPHNTELPHKLEMLTIEMRNFVTIPKRVSSSSQNSQQVDLNSDTTETDLLLAAAAALAAGSSDDTSSSSDTGSSYSDSSSSSDSGSSFD